VLVTSDRHSVHFAVMPKRGLGGRLMTDDEWESFWDVIHSRRQKVEPEPPLGSDTESNHDDDDAAPDARRSGGPQGWASDASAVRRRIVRSNRCGSCVACRSKDCGTCKNCLDKPRFGGPGVKKKACMSRVCINPPAKDADDYQSDDAQTAPVSPALAASSPPHHAFAERGGNCAPMPLSMLPLSRRPPLLPLDMQSALAPFNFPTFGGGGCSLDLLSRAAPQPGTT